MIGWFMNDELNDRMIYEWWIGKDMEGSGHGQIECTIWHLCGGTEENHKKPQSE
jgi:hypothetical protein